MYFWYFQDEFGCYWPEDGFNSYGVVNVAIDEINKNYAASGFIVRKFRLTDTRVSSIFYRLMIDIKRKLVFEISYHHDKEKSVFRLELKKTIILK